MAFKIIKKEVPEKKFLSWDRAKTWTLHITAFAPPTYNAELVKYYKLVTTNVFTNTVPAPQLKL